MELKKLIVKNFKGIESFALEPDGESISVFGDNATGKSTLFDSVTWLFFGKDSQNSANFDIKTLQSDGEPEHGLEHMVEGIFSNNGNDLSLKKVYSEKWVKRRGAAHREFTGHTVDHFIDGVPVKQKEYNTAINDICDETIFKLLTNPRFINEVMHWQERRKLLLEVCGDISDEDVIASDSSLAELPDILKKRKLEDHRKVIASKKAEINKELDKIPVRIDEIKGSFVECRDTQEVEKDLTGAKEELKDAQEVLKEIKAGGESEVLVSKLRKVENQIQDLDNKEAAESLKARQARDDERRKLKKAVDDIQDNIDENKKSLNRVIDDKEESAKSIEAFSKQADQLRQRWHDENDRAFKFDQSDTCPSCGQGLPKDKLEAARNKAEEGFNNLKALALEAINKEGKDLVKEVGFKEKRIKELDEKIKDINRSLKGLDEQKGLAKKSLNIFDTKYGTESDKKTDNPERLALLASKEEIEKQIEAKKGSVDPEAIKTGEAQIEGIEIRIEAYKKELMQIEANKRIDVRVKELSDQERNLSAEFEELERQLYLTEEFIRRKVSLLEEKINGKFKIARFKLFKENINGGLEQCCEVMSNGVPYSSMNNAARINIGLDICNTLSKHFNKKLPCFIDNAEAVTDLLPMDTQQIKLIVSAKDKKLRIE